MKKMKLVSEAELDRLRAKQIRDYDPEIYILSQLQKQIDEVMTNPKISDYDKMTLLQNAQHRYRAISHADAVERAGFAVDSKPKPPAVATAGPALPRTPALPRAPAPLPLAPAPPMDEPENGESEQSEEDEIPPLEAREDAYIESLPSLYQRKAERFFDWMKEHKDVVFYDDQNQLVINGTAIPGTNFQEIFRHLFVHSKKTKPVGSSQIASALRRLGLPANMISNKDALSLRQVPKAKSQTGKGVRIKRYRSRSRSPSPPGRKPVVLRVYSDV